MQRRLDFAIWRQARSVFVARRHCIKAESEPVRNFVRKKRGKSGNRGSRGSSISQPVSMAKCSPGVAIFNRGAILPDRCISACRGKAEGQAWQTDREG